MPIDLNQQLLLFFISLVANIFSAFSGGGAGLIQLPALIFLGLPFTVALATHKIATVALGIGATIRYIRSRFVQFHFAWFMLACGLPGVVIGANYILHIPGRMAEIALGLLTIGLGAYSVMKKAFGQKSNERHRDIKGMVYGGVGFFVIGFINGSLTSGTGLFATIWLVRWFGFDYKTAVAYTLILVGIFWNGAGAVTLGIKSDIQWWWLPALLAGSLLGGFIGAHLAIVKGNKAIKLVFEVVAISVGIKLIVG